jgi:CheY-like chemotaxis protein
MLVDDIALNIHILSLHLRNLGVQETLQAESGEKALEAMRARRPSVVFTDLWMPGMNGAALARAVRTDPSFAGIPVVAVTADNDTAASFDVSVFDDILVKPISTDKVSECLARLFPGH